MNSFIHQITNIFIHWIEVLGHRYPFLFTPLVIILIPFINRGNQSAVNVFSKILEKRITAGSLQKISPRIKHAFNEIGTLALWNFWLETRKPSLEQFLLSNEIFPNTSSPVTIYILALKGDLKRLSQIPPNLLHVLIRASRDENSQIAEIASNSLRRLRGQSTINAFCAHWAETRDPHLEEILHSSQYLPDRFQKEFTLVCLKTNRIADILECPPEKLEELLQACTDQDAEIRDRARSALPFLRNEETIQHLFDIWLEKRYSFLEDWIKRGVFHPTPGTPVWLAVNLKRQKTILPEELPIDLVASLASFCFDPDLDIKAGARDLLTKLPIHLIDRLGELGIKGDQHAIDLWKEFHLTSSKPEIQACMLLFAGQLEEYFQFDYDQRIMQFFFLSLPPDVRSRVTQLIQRLGHPSLVRILAVHEIPKEIQHLQPEVIETAIRIYTDHQRLDDLWSLVHTVPPKYGMSILITLLNQSQWEPRENNTLYRDFIEKLKPIPEIKLSKIHEEIPRLIHQATVRVGGRVNDFDVIPQTSLIAIATSNQQIILWDYQQAKIDKRIRGFSHSLAKVIALSENTLIVTERSTGTTPCGIYAIHNGDIEKIGEHLNSITEILKINSTQYFSVHKNGDVFVGDLQRYPTTPQHKIPFLPKAVGIDPLQQKAALIQEKYPYILDLRSFEPITGEYNRISALKKGKGVATFITFSHSEDALLIGKRNGALHLYPLSSKTCALGDLFSPIVFIGFIPGEEKYIAMAKNGNILWLDARYNPNHMEKLPYDNITTVEIFQKGQFMVVGHQHRMFTFWDLRSHLFFRWLEEPASSLTIEDLMIIRSFKQNSFLSQSLQWMLTYLDALLTHRFQYDILISEPVSILPGEFDILLDEDIG